MLGEVVCGLGEVVYGLAGGLGGGGRNVGCRPFLLALVPPSSCWCAPLSPSVPATFAQTFANIAKDADTMARCARTILHIRSQQTKIISLFQVFGQSDICGGVLAGLAVCIGMLSALKAKNPEQYASIMASVYDLHAKMCGDDNRGVSNAVGTAYKLTSLARHYLSLVQVRCGVGAVSSCCVSCGVCHNVCVVGVYCVYRKRRNSL